MAQSTFGDLIQADLPVLVDFYADWCGPCKAQAPILKEFKKQVGERIRIVKIDTDRNQELSQQMGIKSIPTLMMFRNGRVVWTAHGVQDVATLSKQLEVAESLT